MGKSGPPVNGRGRFCCPYWYTGAHLVFADPNGVGRDAGLVSQLLAWSRLRSGKAEAQVVVADAWMVPVAVGCARIARVVVPRTATNDTLGASSTDTVLSIMANHDLGVHRWMTALLLTAPPSSISVSGDGTSSRVAHL